MFHVTVGKIPSYRHTAVFRESALQTILPIPRRYSTLTFTYLINVCRNVFCIQRCTHNVILLYIVAWKYALWVNRTSGRWTLSWTGSSWNYFRPVIYRDVKASRPVWPRGQIIRPRPRPRCIWPRPHRSWPRGLEIWTLNPTDGALIPPQTIFITLTFCCDNR